MDDFFRAQDRDLTELMVDNFFPIHAYIFHTRAMPPGWLRFDESLDRLEDYECLYRVVASSLPPWGGGWLIGLYCWHGDGLSRANRGHRRWETNAWERNRRSWRRR